MAKQYWHDAITQNCVWLFQLIGCTGEITTDRVFLTREEARAYGESRPYAYGKMGRNWKIYGVPCEGLMADILGENLNKFIDKIDKQ